MRKLNLKKGEENNCMMNIDYKKFNKEFREQAKRNKERAMKQIQHSELENHFGTIFFFFLYR